MICSHVFGHSLQFTYGKYLCCTKLTWVHFLWNSTLSLADARALVDVGNVGANIVAQNSGAKLQLQEMSPSSIAKRGLSKLSDIFSPLPSRRSISVSDILNGHTYNRTLINFTVTIRKLKRVIRMEYHVHPILIWCPIFYSDSLNHHGWGLEFISCS